MKMPRKTIEGPDLKKLIAKIKDDGLLPDVPASSNVKAKGGKQANDRLRRAYRELNAERRLAADTLSTFYGTRQVMLNKPFLIWHFQPKPSDSGAKAFKKVLEFDYNITAGDSSARIGLETWRVGEFRSEVAFFYLWVNDAGERAVVDVEAPVVFDNGKYSAQAAAVGPFAVYNFAVIRSRLSTGRPWFNPAGYQGHSIVTLEEAQVRVGGPTIDDVIYVSHARYDLFALQNVVEPGESILIRVSARFYADIHSNLSDDDRAKFDFYSQGSIRSPYVNLKVSVPMPGIFHP